MGRINQIAVAVPQRLNTSGIEPIEFKVVVEPIKDTGEIVFKSGHKLLKPDDIRDRDDHAACEGVLVAVSPTAFTYETDAPRPAVGSRVLFAKYSGMSRTGKDGREYRIMNDKDIAAVLA
jgi:co-chaperonin GroES (HSP10)